MAQATAAKGPAFDRTRLEPAADWLAVGVAIALPWSISITQILLAAWLIALLPTLDIAAIRRVLRHPAGGLPVLLWLLALAGTLWAVVPWGERLAGLSGFNKLLFIPLLLAQFQRSARGRYVLYGFFASCTALLAASWLLMMLWKLWGVHVPGKLPGLLVRDYIAQGTEFLVCTFASLGYAAVRWRVQPTRAVAAVALAILFLANIFYIAPSRTTLVLLPLLLLLFGFWFFGWKGGAIACVAAAVVAAAAWAGSPLLRLRVLASISEVQSYQQKEGAISSSGIRLEFQKRSLAIIEKAPLIGHGTGSIPDQFRRAASGEGVSAIAGENPHNQIFAVGIQLGLVGIAVLMTMWLWHLALFRGGGSLVAWVGIVVVLQNIASAPFNSHLFDSFHGWLYVILFGVAGGIALREREEVTA